MRQTRSKGIADGITLVVHQPADFFAPAEIPDFDDLICAAGREPFAACWRGCDGFDAGNVRGEDEDRGEVDPERGVVVVVVDGGVGGGRQVGFEAIEQFFVGSGDDFE